MKIPIPKSLFRRLAWMVVLLTAAAFLALALRPEPVEVDVATAVRGPLRVTLDEEGETRVHDRYVIGAPVAGRLRRVELHEGDSVTPGQELARLDPAPLDPRSREQAEARLATARATASEAKARAAQAGTALDEARRKLRRAERLATDGVIPPEELDAARTAARAAEEELTAARARARAAGYEIETARAALLEGTGAGDTVPIRAPVQGRVLRVCEQCERVVPAGTPLLELGDPGALEIVVDLLSSDAVHVRPGTPMILRAGEGEEERELRGRVRLVEPSGFTKVSPLGVEEQRVNVIGDFVDPPGRLGDRYRVEVSLVIWEGRDVLQVPTGALFRHAGQWSVFRIEDGRARRREVRIGQRNPFAAQVLAGLKEGEAVVVHPGDQVMDGVRVE